MRWSDPARGFNNDTPGQDGRRNVVRYDCLSSVASLPGFLG